MYASGMAIDILWWLLHRCLSVCLPSLHGMYTAAPPSLPPSARIGLTLPLLATTAAAQLAPPPPKLMPWASGRLLL